MHWWKFRDILILILHESLIFLYQGIKLRSRQFRWTLSLTYFVFSFADGLHYSLVSLMVLREIVIFNGKLTALKLFVIKEKLLESNLKPKRKSDLIKVNCTQPFIFFDMLNRVLIFSLFFLPISESQVILEKEFGTKL